MISATSIATKWFWGLVAMFFVVLSIGLALALIVVTRQRDGLLHTSTSVTTVSKISEDIKPSVCGSVNTNKNIINLTESDSPGPFQSLTSAEIKKLRQYLELRPEIKAAKAGAVTLSSSTIFAIDLLLPTKSDVLGFLKKTDASELPRFARVMIFRGDKDPPVVEEWKCGPLKQIDSCNILTMNNTSTRNPVEFNIRPLIALDFDKNGAFKYLLNKMEQEIGLVLLDSYNASFLSCAIPEDCLVLGVSPVTSNVLNNMTERHVWVFPLYNITFPTLHPLGMSILCTMNGVDPSKWTFTKIWYSGQMFSSAVDFKNNYVGNSITKIKMFKPMQNDTPPESLRGNQQPGKPQRAPTLVESDGKRYSLNNGQVTYLNWAFNFLMSSMSGPAIFNVRFKGERIAYEIALNEIDAYYPGGEQWKQAMNYPNGGRMTNKLFRTLVPGTDCPGTATIITQPTLNLYGELVDSVAFCLFEQNNGIPLRRHLAYTVSEGGFYGGLMDYVLILRSLIEVSKYDYIVDFIFHQNGALQTRITPTGEGLLESWHLHLINFKVDLDIAGISNVYQTWDIHTEEVSYQNKIVRTLKTSELDALYLFNFGKPKHHIVFNNSTKNAYGENRGYSIQLEDISTSVMPTNVGFMPWAQHQIVVTKHKDSELRSSSFYGMFDKANPTVKFMDFYQDNDTIVNEDLVFWITSGAVQIRSSETMPFTTTVGTNIEFTLSPFNYHSECPSMSSRDAIYIQHRDPADHLKGLIVNRNGNSNTQCLTSQPSLDLPYVKI